jgi:3-isopropylmalate/(R)-2-methylmalate dehydratase small subunit
MTPFTTLTAVAAPLLRDNVDTDAIIPSREMKSTSRTGLAEGLFAPWRYCSADARTPKPGFVLNDSRYAGAQILVGGANFGCGSSREHAVWALAEYGFRAVIASGFAPIFAANCIRNGVVPAVLDADAVAQVAAAAPGPVTVDLVAGHVALPNGRAWPFALEAEARTMLLEGLDAIDLTLKQRPAIAAFHARDRLARPWIYLDEGEQ